MPNFYVKEVTNSGPNISIFRRVSRQASGECFNPYDSSRVFFAYERNKQSGSKDNVLGVASYIPADWTLHVPSGSNHEDAYYHILSFLFVVPYYQNSGCGSQLLRTVERDALSRCKRNIRIMSAEKAVRFFGKSKYLACGNPIHSACSGSPLFNRLVPMEKTYSSPKNSRHGFRKEDVATLHSGISKTADHHQSILPKEEQEARKKDVLQWNISNYEIESSENWEDK